jgi:hypothetical protein
MVLPNCSTPGLTGAAKQLCALFTGTAKTGPIHHSKNFRECAANYIALSNPQKLSNAQEFEHLDYQTAHCKAYIDLFAEDYEYHKHHGGWLTGYVDYGLHNGLNVPAKHHRAPKEHVPTDPLMHIVHPPLTKPNHSFLDEVHFSLLGYTFGPVVSWAVIIGGVLVVYWYFRR